MISKNAIENIVQKQLRHADSLSAGFTREVSSTLPYLSDRALLLGGMRGSGCSTILTQLLRSDYIKAWYTDFEDPRLAGFDQEDFPKLIHLIADSGRGVVLLDRVDTIEGWQLFIKTLLERGVKVISTISLAWYNLIEASVEAKDYHLCRVTPLSYNEFLATTRRSSSSDSVVEYIAKGAFPSQVTSSSKENALLALYGNIVMRDVIIPAGVRDRASLQRIALHLMDSCGEAVSANALRNKLKVKAVSTVTEHFELLSRAGLFSFIPIYSDRPSQQSVNPRKVYPADTAMAAAVTTLPALSRERLFEVAIFGYINRRCDHIFYTSGGGGCDFVVRDQNEQTVCIQACYDTEDLDTWQQKIEGLLWAMESTSAVRGVIVTLGQSDTIVLNGREIEIVDADSFLCGDCSI